MRLDLRVYAIADPGVSGGRSLAELANSDRAFHDARATAR